MDKIKLESDINIICVKAETFPEGIEAAYKKLSSLFPGEKRNFFGISWMEGGIIIYFAAAEELSPGEAEKLNCERMTIKKGEYISETIKDFLKHIPELGKTFQEMFTRKDIDRESFCVERYHGDDVDCMVRLKD